MEITIVIKRTIEIPDGKIEKLKRNFCRRWDTEYTKGMDIDDSDLLIQAEIDGVIDELPEDWTVE